MTDGTSPRTGRTRRTVLRTAAWTTPAVAVAAAVPAFAASVNDILNPKFTKINDGRFATVLAISVTNDGPATLASGTVQVTLTAAAAVFYQPLDDSLVWTVLDPKPNQVLKSVTWVYNLTVPVGIDVRLPGLLRVQTANSLDYAVTFAYVGPQQ